MSATAIIMGGVPPASLGVYGRAVVLGAPFRWRAVNASRADVATQVAQARAYGGGVWLWSGPESFSPRAWRGTLARILSLCESLGCDGIIVDPESEWPALTTAARASELIAFGAALRDASTRVRVGITSYPMFPGIDVLAREAGSRVWGSPQIYGRTSLNAADFDSWYARWTDIFGAARVIPSVAGWESVPALGTADGFRAYLASVPRAGGAIVWPPQRELAPHIAAALADYSPGGNPVGTAAAVAFSVAARPTFMVAALVVAALAVGAFFLARKG